MRSLRKLAPVVYVYDVRFRFALVIPHPFYSLFMIPSVTGRLGFLFFHSFLTVYILHVLAASFLPPPLLG